MPKITLRCGVWTGVAVLAVVVLTGSTYLLTRKHPGPPHREVVVPPQEDVAGEERRAKALPEYAEIRKLMAKGDRLAAPADVARAGELAEHPNFFIRLMAVATLGNATGPVRPEAAARVAPRLRDDNLHVRVGAMDALARLEAREYIPELVAFLDRGDDERANAKRALKRLGHPAP